MEERERCGSFLATPSALFDDWLVITAWSGLGSKRGRMRNTYVSSYEAGLQQLASIDKRRQQRGYRSAS